MYLYKGFSIGRGVILDCNLTELLAGTGLLREEQNTLPSHQPSQTNNHQSIENTLQSAASRQPSMHPPMLCFEARPVPAVNKAAKYAHRVYPGFLIRSACDLPLILNACESSLRQPHRSEEVFPLLGCAVTPHSAV